MLSEDTISQTSDDSELLCDEKTLSKSELLGKIKKQSEEIETLTKRAEKAERLLERSQNFNEELRAQIKSLSNQLHEYRSLKKNALSVAVQVSSESCTNVEKPMPSWEVETDENNSALSISECLKAAAEEIVQEHEQSDMKEHQENQSSDYVYDAQTGYYYHPASGYYWDPVSRLFYDYTSGTYYNYDETTGEYKVYSQVDLTSNVNNTVQTNNKDQADHKKRKRKKSKKSSRQKGQISSAQNVICIDDTDSSEDEKNQKLSAHNPSKQGKFTVENSSKARHEIIGHDPAEESESSGSLATGESELVSSPESGEITRFSENEEENSAQYCEKQDRDQEQQWQCDPECAENYPPCIRLIVLKSEQLPLGSLHIITCAGGTIGREPNMGHAIEIHDLNISKVHAEIKYDYDCSCYKITDRGSQNGTLLNNRRLSMLDLASLLEQRGQNLSLDLVIDGKKPSPEEIVVTLKEKPKSSLNSHTRVSRCLQNKEKSSAYDLHHEDIMELGGTQLLLHIHRGNDTCEGCEPGQVQARLRAENPIKNDHVVLSKDQRNRQRLKDLKQIKKKYGLQNSHFEHQGTNPSNPEYCDKAYLRRKYIGSEPMEHATPQELPSSVQSPISSSNKGHKLLSKMGWKEGEGLGKTNSGISEPINVELRVNQNAGLGSAEGVSLSMDNIHKSGKAKRWAQARQMYNKLEAQETELDKLPNRSQHLTDGSGATPETSQLQSLRTHEIGDSVKTSFNQPENATTVATYDRSKKYLSIPKISWVKGDVQQPTNRDDSAP